MSEANTHELASALVDGAASAAKVATYGGGAASALGGFVLSSEGMALMGLAVAVAGLALNLYFNAQRRRLDLRRDEREEREHLARMAVIEQVKDAP